MKPVKIEHLSVQCTNVCPSEVCFRVKVMVFNATLNNIGVISSVLLVEETGVPGENH
jgi:hypothetical protein